MKRNFRRFERCAQVALWCVFSSGCASDPDEGAAATTLNPSASDATLSTMTTGSATAVETTPGHTSPATQVTSTASASIDAPASAIPTPNPMSSSNPGPEQQGGAPSDSATTGDSAVSSGAGDGSAVLDSGASGGQSNAGGAGGEAGASNARDAGSTALPGVDVDPNAIFVAPDGVAGAQGTIDDPTSLDAALDNVGAGVTIYLRAGSYARAGTLDLSADGAEGEPITLSAYPLDEQRPRLDFSAMAEDSGNRGVSVSGDHWHIYGLDLFKAGDNCMFVSGSHNTIEHSTFSECADTGLQLGNGAADNLVLNCDSYYNADSALENADGFAAKLDVGTGNKFVGCRAWNNLDDGWDGYLRPADNVTTTYERCWAFDNGKLQDGSVGAGDGNGFKSGGSDDKDLRHNAVYTQCIAASNVHDGFDHNSNRGEVTIHNSAAHGNGVNINFSASNIAAKLIIKNTISLGNTGDLEATSTELVSNSWQTGLSATDEDFVSVDTSLLKAPRKRDGSLPEIEYLRLTSSSDLRNAGVDIGLPYVGSAPDLGPFESSE